MPGVLAPEAWPAWLGEETGGRARPEIPPGPLPLGSDGLLAGQSARRQRQEQRSAADRADCFAVSERLYRLRRPVTLNSILELGAIKPMRDADIARAVQLLDLMHEFFADGGHWTRGCYDDGNGGHCLVGALLHLGRKHGLPTAPAIALLQDAMPRPGLPLVHFNDTRCSSVAELRSVILKARRLAHDHGAQERAAAAVKTWLLAQIENKRAAPTPDIMKTAPDGVFAPERLAA